MDTRGPSRAAVPTACVALALLVLVPAAGAGVPPDPRSLPSVVMRWTWDARRPQSMALDGGVAYVQDTGRVAALDAVTGSVRWEQRYQAADDGLSAPPPVVLGSALAVAAGKRVLVLDRATGEVQRSIDLGGWVSHMTGPPLVVSVAGEEVHPELVAIDADAGEVRARRPVGDNVYFLDLCDGVLVAELARRDARGERVRTLVGLRPGDLSEIWRLDPSVYRGFRRIQGRPYADTAGGRYAPVDPATGRTGPPLAQAVSVNPVWGEWDLQFASRDDETGQSRLRRLRRIDLDRGDDVWTATLPAPYLTSARTADRLFVLCGERGRASGHLAVLDWATGQVERLIAAPLGSPLEVFQDVLIVRAADGFRAWSAREAGPTEASVHPVREEVHRLLRGRNPPGGDGWNDPLADDLRALGPEALPFIAREVPTAEARPLMAAAFVLGEAGYTKAGALLARRLGEMAAKARDDKTGVGERYLRRMLEALGRTGGAAEVEPVSRILEDPSWPLETRRTAFTALAGIGSPEAVRVLDRALATLAPPRVAWTPPLPPPAVDAARTARVEEPGGSTLVVFENGYLGGMHDLWLAELAADGRPRGPSVFLGASTIVEECYLPLPCRSAARMAGNAMHARVERGVLEIQPADPEAVPMRIDLGEASRDTDGDGLTDAVERRLRTDPARADTDGDGMGDALDPSPDCARTVAS